jgi:hypothetical protein
MCHATDGERASEGQRLSKQPEGEVRGFSRRCDNGPQVTTDMEGCDRRAYLLEFRRPARKARNSSSFLLATWQSSLKIRLKRFETKC